MIQPLISCLCPSIEVTKYILLNSDKILKCYKHLIDSYVLDFFTYNHWDNLPESWRLFFRNVSPENLQIFLNLNKASICGHHVMPLEIICLRILIKHLSIPRQNLNIKDSCINVLNYPKDIEMLANCASRLTENSKIERMFWKHIKKKKRHEIKSFARITHEIAKKTRCLFVVDIGSGLGHLSRWLAYGYGLKVCSIECEEKLTFQARQLDKAFEKQVAIYDKNFLISKHAPIHVNYTINPDINSDVFIKIIENAFKNDVSFGIVGLHPCGDLGPALLKLYNTCQNIKFLNIVGCCYMKLTSSIDSGICGYPISEFCLENKFHLSYNAREVACHALESYLEKLKSGKHWQLKVHSYRAAIEYLIVKEYPHMKHSPLSNVKYQPNMTFNDYCSRALKNIGIKLSQDCINSDVIDEFLNDWQLVVTFYSIRLLFAPLIESVILLDRYLYLHENQGGMCCISPAFDPLLSPRNHILLALKNFGVK